MAATLEENPDVNGLTLAPEVGLEPKIGVFSNVKVVPLDASCVSLIATHNTYATNKVKVYVAFSGAE